jgi:enoyl-CoA hydratase/carnithine racemase
MTPAAPGPETAIARRDLLTLVGTAAAGVAAVGSAFAQSPAPSNGTAPAQPQAKSTVVLDRLPMGVFLIGIDRAEAENRIDIPTFSALGQAYYEFEHDDGLRVAVLYGNGPDFSRGLDIASWGAGLRAGPFQAPPRFLDPFGTSGPERTKPLVVAVQGHVTRIAHELFLAADVRVAARDTVFNQGEVTAASFPGGGATTRFVREAGWGNAMRYMLTGADWSADEAYRMGLVQELTAPGQQLDWSIDFAKQIAAAAPLGVRALLASAHRALSESEKLALATLQPAFVQLLRSEDRQEYLRALQENRAPVFVGR